MFKLLRTLSCVSPVSFMFSVLHQLQDYFADEVGVLSPNQIQVDELYAGEVVYSFEHNILFVLYTLYFPVHPCPIFLLNFFLSAETLVL